MDTFPTKRTASPAKSPAKSPARPRAKADDGPGRGMEFAIVVFLFLGVGYALDRWFGTKPLFMIVLVVLALVGQFASMWYGYDARMKVLEAERADNATRAGRRGDSAPGQASAS